MGKQGTEYELFVKEVYECLNRADGLSDVKILHDVILKGAAGVGHQIDVYWTFCKAGVAYKVAVECKDYKNRVSKEKIAAFHDILQDIGNIHGIFATKMGFQSGAKEYAEKYGIQLMEIRHPIDKDWEGKMKDFHITLHIQTIGKVTPKIYIDGDRLAKMNTTLPKNMQFVANSGLTIIKFSELSIDGKSIATNDTITMQDLINKLPVNEAGQDKECLCGLRGGWLQFGKMTYPLTAIKFNYEVHEHIENIDIYGDDVIKAIVKNITDKTEIHIDKFGRVNNR